MALCFTRKAPRVGWGANGVVAGERSSRSAPKTRLEPNPLCGGETCFVVRRSTEPRSQCVRRRKLRGSLAPASLSLDEIP